MVSEGAQKRSAAQAPRSVRRRSFDAGRLARGRRGGGILARVWTSGPPGLGWKSLTGRPERKRYAFHTRSMGTARPRASALAGQHLPQHVATVPIRLMFNAKHTRSHSPRTFAKPRRLNRRNPSTSLIHPFGASREPLALRVPGFARGARQFLTHAVRGREPGPGRPPPGTCLHAPALRARRCRVRRDDQDETRTTIRVRREAAA